MDNEVEEPSAGLTNKEPSAGLTNKEPSAGLTNKEPSADLTNKEPSAGLIVKKPSAGLTIKEPSTGQNNEASSEDSGKEASAGSDKAFSLLDPKIDLVFKAIFGNADHPNRLLDLINAVLEAFGEPGIKAITLINPSLDPEHPEEKGVILDIGAVSDLGEPINVELQMVDRQNWPQRSLYYWSRLYDDQLDKGDDYSRLKKTISISLLDFKLFDRSRLYSLYELRERRDQERLSDLLQMYFIELPKSADAADEEELPPHLAEWVQFFNVKSEEDLARLPKGNCALQEASEMLNEISRKPYERQLYEARRKAMLDYNNDMREIREARQAREEAEKQAREAEKQAREAEKQAREAEKQAKEAEKQAKEAEKQAKEVEKQGRAEGRVEVLLEQGVSKFGELPRWVEERLRHATAEQIQEWSKTILHANSLQVWLKE